MGLRVVNSHLTRTNFRNKHKTKSEGPLASHCCELSLPQTQINIDMWIKKHRVNSQRGNGIIIRAIHKYHFLPKLV